MLTRLKTSKFSDRINSIPIKVDRMNEKINYKMRWKPTFDSIRINQKQVTNTY